MVSGIIMASGLSRRMGRCKLLMDFGDRPLVDIVMEAVERSSLNPKLVVTGNEKIMELALKRNLQVIENKKGPLGQSESIRLGVLNSIEGDGYCFIVGDQPFIRSGFIDTLVNTFENQRNKIIVPLYKGTRGNPVIFPKTYREELLSLQGDLGGKEILKKYSENIKYVEIFEERVLEDIDREEDFFKLLSYKGEEFSSGYKKEPS